MLQPIVWMHAIDNIKRIISHENNTVVKVTPPSKNIVLLFGQPEKVGISIYLPN